MERRIILTDNTHIIGLIANRKNLKECDGWLLKIVSDIDETTEFIHHGAFKLCNFRGEHSKWISEIYLKDGTTRIVYDGRSRLEAIVMLWKSRAEVMQTI